MVEVVGITLNGSDHIYYFSPNNIKVKVNITVIVETERGLQFGKIAKEPFLMDEKRLEFPLKNIIRIATKQDYFANKKNVKDAEEAFKKCKDLVQKYNLNMKILDSSYTFDRSQLMFRFLADSRVDFRALAKELASIYRTRIELRQVGIRDKAKEIGGIGSCGRALCCASFLKNFESVSINMAKNQNVSLNQTKINGVCGRLLCCLKYEDDNYTKCRECLPKIGDQVETEEGIGKVVSVDILKQKYAVEIPNVGIIEMGKACGKY